jgi:Fic family protein
MTYVLLALVIASAGLTAAWAYARRQAKLYQTTPREELSGLFQVVTERTQRKNQLKARILQLFEGRYELTNADIRESLGIPRRSVTRYMNELEKEGRIKQIGASGRFVTYKLA